MAESKFEKYKELLKQEAQRARAGEKSDIFNAGNIAAAGLFIILAGVWLFYFAVKFRSPAGEDLDKNRRLKAVFFDVGTGDCTLLITPSKKTILIDAGGRPGHIIEEGKDTVEQKYDAAKHLIIPYLTKELQLSATNFPLPSPQANLLGTSRFPLFIDCFVVSHKHTDHYGGFITLIENKIIPKTVYAGKTDTDNPLYETFLRQIKDNKIKLIVPAAGQIVDFGDGVAGEFLGPVSSGYSGTGADENNSSVVLKIMYKNISILFTGDIESAAENDLGNWRNGLKSTILKVPHHGSGTSSSSPFIDRVSPSAAVISVGYDGSIFGYPDENVIKKLTDRNINIYRTDQDGTITLLTSGKSFKIATEK